MRVVGYIAAIIAAVVMILSLCFGLTWLGLEWRGFFGPKRAAVERRIFKETRSFNEGMVQQLAKYRIEHIRAETDMEKRSIESVVRHMFADFNPEKLDNPELRNFLMRCMK